MASKGTTRPIAHIAGKARRFVAEQVAAHHRAHAVGADDDIRFVLAAVLEGGHGGGALVAHRCACRGQRHRGFRNAPYHDLVQVRAVHVIEIGAVQPRAFAGQRHAELFARGLPVASHQGLRQKADIAQVVGQAQRLQHLHGVRRHLDAGADLAECLRALE